MTREDLIRKWLDNELNDQELKAFQAFDDYDELVKMSDNMKAFSAPEFDVESNLSKTLDRIRTSEPQKKTVKWSTHLMRVAAILVVGLGITYFALNQTTSFDTSIAQKMSIELPDASSVELNALSTISFKERNWDENRDVFLEGEAYFKVAKGQSFNVITDAGTVTVLGTEFNVKHRNGLFKVVCYEGSVKVSGAIGDTVLKPGDQFLILDGKFIATEKENQAQPAWLSSKSKFASMPYSRVINELERQYKVEISAENIDMSTRFTGTFTHNDLSLALKSITLPLNLKYHQTDDGTIVISSD